MNRRRIGILLIGLGLLSFTILAIAGLVSTLGRVGRQVAWQVAPQISLERVIEVEPTVPPPVIERVIPPLGFEQRLEGLGDRLSEIESRRWRLDGPAFEGPAAEWPSPDAFQITVSTGSGLGLASLWPYLASLVRGLVNLLAIGLILVGVGLLLWRRSQPAEKLPPEKIGS